MTNHNHYTLYVLQAVDLIKQDIEKDPFKHKTCKELLDSITPVNRKILEKAFKELHGYRIKAYQVKQRLAFSKNYLQEGLPVKRVAAKCYYRSQSAYCTAFKKEFGLTPTEWVRITIQRTPPMLN